MQVPKSGKRMPKLWDKKPIAVLQAEAADVATQELMTHGGVPLRRTLSAMSLMALGIGNIIGAGIFVLTGQAAAAHAGPAIGLSFVVSAIACAFADRKSTRLNSSHANISYAVFCLKKKIKKKRKQDICTERIQG